MYNEINLSIAEVGGGGGGGVKGGGGWGIKYF